MKNLQGKNLKTGNIGHDTAKGRLSRKLEDTGYNVRNIINGIKAKENVKFLMAMGLVKIERIGQDYVIKCVDSLYVKQTRNGKEVGYVEKTHTLNNNVTIVSVVNNIATSQVGSSNVGKTMYWINNKDAVKYKKEIIIGADILSLNWVKKTYSKDMICTLSERKKFEKYNGQL